MVKLILDTDIGDDIDDAFALLYAIKSPNIDLKAVTTVIDNTVARAKIAKRILCDFEYAHVDVFAGESQPFSKQSRYTHTSPPQYLPSFMDEMEISSKHAVEAMYALLTNEEELEILTIGTLGNIAKLIIEYPDSISKIKRLHVMGGCYYHHMNEWNIERDPEAAKIVFESGIPMNLIGLDVTTRCRLSSEQVSFIRKIKGEVEVISLMMDMWMEKVDRDGVVNPILHDPLALHSLLDNDDVKFQPEHIKIETKGEYTRGATFTEPYRLWGGKVPPSITNVAYDVNPDAFINEFFNICFDGGS